MPLTVKQKSNIRHFAYYLVNGTLDFELIQKTFGNSYHSCLKSNTNLFYKTGCVFINQELWLNPDWLDAKKLGKFICQLYTNTISTDDFKDWETDCTTDKPNYSSDFKKFMQWFIRFQVASGITFDSYIDDGATFVEQCFAIWANVVQVENSAIINHKHAIDRVEQYIKSYYIDGFTDNLEDWECELY